MAKEYQYSTNHVWCAGKKVTRKMVYENQWKWFIDAYNRSRNITNALKSVYSYYVKPEFR